MKGRKPASRRGVNENEIKLALPDAATARRLLRRAGFRVAKARVFEANTVLDTPARDIINAGRLLRLRQVRAQGILTHKGPAQGGHRHKSREEIETRLDDPASAQRIFECLGYRPVFRYEKFRTEFHRGAEPGVAQIDETPIGVFLELEGPPRWVDRTAHTLGFATSDYILKSYGRLYIEFCEARGIPPRNMVFGRRAATS
jgi:adenylate cyclase class 2